MNQYENYNNQDFEKKRNASLNFGRLIVVMFCLGIAGIGALLVVFGMKQSEKIEEKAEYYVDVEARIVDIVVRYSGDDTHYDVFVEYEYNGKTYGGELNYYTSTMGIGGVVELMCDPDKPHEFIAKGVFGNVGKVICIVGGIFIGVSLFIMKICLAATRKKKK